MPWPIYIGSDIGLIIPQRRARSFCSSILHVSGVCGCIFKIALIYIRYFSNVSNGHYWLPASKIKTLKNALIAARKTVANSVRRKVMMHEKLLFGII